MQYEPITIERLEYYSEGVKELKHLLNQKQNLVEKISGVSGIDYSRVKVTSGNKQKTTEQERYVKSLEYINKRIDELSDWLEVEGRIILTQINRIIRWEYRRVLTERYIRKRKWSEIVQAFFEFESDFEEQKENKYREKVLDWNKAALKQLAEISEKPYIPVDKQLQLFCKTKEGGK